MIAVELSLALALLSARPAPAPQPRPREVSADALLREAKSLRYAQRWFEASASYRRFLNSNPGSGRVPEARFWLAATLESDQRWDEAAQAYSEFLTAHPSERLLGREAKLNRIRCWGLRQGQTAQASPGLLAALEDPHLEVQVAAALQLAKTGDGRAVPVLKRGLTLASGSPACSMALISLGVKPVQPQATSQVRFLVLRVREAGKSEPVTIRLALSLAVAVGNYLSDEQLRQVQAKGVDLAGLSAKAAQLPKGSVLFSVEDGKSSVAVTVE